MESSRPGKESTHLMLCKISFLVFGDERTNPRNEELFQSNHVFQGFSMPHAVVSNGSDIYVGEIGPNRVWKFKHPSAG